MAVCSHTMHTPWPICSPGPARCPGSRATTTSPPPHTHTSPAPPPAPPASAPPGRSCCPPAGGSRRPPAAAAPPPATSPGDGSWPRWSRRTPARGGQKEGAAESATAAAASWHSCTQPGMPSMLHDTARPCTAALSVHLLPQCTARLQRLAQCSAGCRAATAPHLRAHTDAASMSRVWYVYPGMRTQVSCLAQGTAARAADAGGSWWHTDPYAGLLQCMGCPLFHAMPALPAGTWQALRSLTMTPWLPL